MLDMSVEFQPGTCSELADSTALWLHDGICRMDVSDVLYFLKKSELRRAVLEPGAKYVKFRRIIVDWMSEVGEEFSLSTTTVHSAIYYLDALLNRVEVQRNNLQLVAMCCILIASKMCEREENIPVIAELNDCSNNTYTADLMRQMESFILRSLEWELKCVVPSTYTPFFLRLGSDPSDRYVDRPVDERVNKYVCKYVDFFLDMSIQEYDFQLYSPAVLSAAAVACSRRAVKVTPVWSPRLESISGLSLSDIQHCIDHIWRVYSENFPQSDNHKSAAVSTTAQSSPVDVKDMDM